MRSLILIALTAAPAYLGYYVLTDAIDRAWAYYVLQGLLALALADCVRRWVPDHVEISLAAWAVGLCWWIEIEAIQQAVCGTLQWGNQVHTDICVQVIGLDVYRGVAALVLAGALTWLPSRSR